MYDRAYWRITERSWDGYPSTIRVMRVEDVIDTPPGNSGMDDNQYPPADPFYYLGSKIPTRDVIKFYGDGNGGWLRNGATAISIASALEAASVMYSETPIPTVVLKNSGADLPAAQVDALLDACSVRAELKWPNDIVAIAAACGGSEGPRKLGGVLSIVVPGHEGIGVILGIGVNVNMGSADLPSPRATSVLLEGGRVDRGELLAALLQALAARVEQWRQGDPVLVTDYRTRCTTIGRHVDVELPGSAVLTGIVTGIDDDGHLLVSDGESTTTITAGDVIHATI